MVPCHITFNDTDATDTNTSPKEITCLGALISKYVPASNPLSFSLCSMYSLNLVLIQKINATNAKMASK